jgi:hypothetical protein
MKIQAPLSYRWLRANGVTRLVPWHFIDETEGHKASLEFATEHPGGGGLWTFARRQDRDDFAGFKIVDGQVTDEVVYYHPSFQGGPNPHIISGTYPDLWAFLRDVVLLDTATWFTDEEDIDDITKRTV